MKSLGFLFFAAAMATPALAFDRDVQKTFSVTPGGELSVETNGGSIQVTTTTQPNVIVTAHEHFRANSESEAEEIANKDLELKIGQNGNDVSVYAKCHNSNGSLWNLFSHSNVWIDISVAVPEEYRAKLKTSGGGIRVDKLGGDLYANTSGGPIEMGHVTGTIQATTSGGGVHLAEGDRDAKLSTSGGPIEVGESRGKLDLDTSGGGIHVKAAMGAVHGETSGGGIEVNFVAALTADSSLETSGGGIRVKLPKDKGAHIDASTSGGDVELVDLEATIESGKLNSGSLKAKLGPGGPTLRLRTSGGGIHISAE